MLSPARSSGVQICLRCQARAWQRWSRAIKSQNPSAARLSTATYRRQEAQQKQEGVIRYESTVDRLQPRHGRSVLKHINPHGRVRGRKGKEVFEDTATLEIESLGKPSEVIVLKEANLGKEDETRQSSSNDQEVQSTILNEQVEGQNILKSIEDAKEAPNQDDVNANIEALRQKTLGYRDGRHSEAQNEQVEALRTRLAASYSYRQLLRYIEHMQSREDTSSPSIKHPLHTEAAIARSEWKPGKHDLNERLPLRKTLSKKHRGLKYGEKQRISKNALVRMILYTCWNVHVAGQEGDLELRLPSAHLTDLLLAGANPSILQRMSQEYSISYTVIRQNVRIRGTFRAASGAADGIVASLSDLKQRSFVIEGLRDWIAKCRVSLPSFFTKSHLDQLLSQCRVAVEYKSGPPRKTTAPGIAVVEQRLTLHAFEEQDIDSAQQALIQLMPIPRAGDCAMVVADKQDTLSIPIIVTTGAPAHKHDQYYRRFSSRHETDTLDPALRSSKIRSPGGLAKLSNADLKETSWLTVLENKLELQQYHVNFLQDQKAETEALSWRMDTPQSITATFGMYAHAANTGETAIKKHGATRKRSAAPSKIGFEPLDRGGSFVPSAPHAFQWLSSQSQAKDQMISMPSLSTSELRFTFLPTPFGVTATVPLAAYAPVELVVQTNPQTGQQTDSRWTANLGKANLILPLPWLSTDLKFTKICQLTAHSIDGTDLQQCLEQVQDSIARDGALSAPPSIHVKAPRVSFSGMDKDPWERPWTHYAWKFRSSSEAVKYLFAGAEFRQCMEMPWRPFAGSPTYRLAYTTVAGGNLVGRRSELTLHLPEMTAEEKGADAKEVKRAFYEAAIELASQVHAAGDLAGAAQTS